jgi:hypothetical protein
MRLRLVLVVMVGLLALRLLQPEETLFSVPFLLLVGGVEEMVFLVRPPAVQVVVGEAQEP